MNIEQAKAIALTEILKKTAQLPSNKKAMIFGITRHSDTKKQPVFM